MKKYLLISILIIGVTLQSFTQVKTYERIPEEGQAGYRMSAGKTNPTRAAQGSIEVAENSTYNTYTPQQLVDSVLRSGCVRTSNAKFGYYSTNGTTWNDASWSSTAGDRQMGYFSKGSSDFPFSEGIVLSTGKISEAEGPNDLYSKTYVISDYHEDPDLETIAGFDSEDAAVLEFDFVPAGNKVEFNYIFASEEYREWSCSDFNDAFGFFLSGHGISGKINLATLPDGTTVTINNIHGEFTADEADDYANHGPICSSSSNIAYYVDNGTGLSGDANNSLTTQFDGMTVVLTATYDVVPCSTYHIKFAVADISDGQWDGGVFIEATSFSSNSAKIYNIGGGIINNTDIFESDNTNCNDTIVVKRTGGDITSDVTYPLNLSGTFTNGTDIVTVPGGGAFPTSVTIPAGQDSVIIAYKAVNDGTSDNMETFIVELDMSCPCEQGSDTQIITMTIYDPITIASITTTTDECDPNTNNGGIVVTASGGTGNYLYSIDGSTYQTSNSFTGLSYGPYTVYVIEAGGLDCNDAVEGSCTVDNNCSPSLTVDKVVDLTSITVPGTLTYAITIVNTGNVDITNVVLIDDLAGTATFTSGDGTDPGVLNVGETWIYSATYEATQADIDAGTDLVNTASVVTKEVPGPTEDAATTTIITADLSLTKAIDDNTPGIGSNVVFTIAILNSGPDDATGVSVRDQLPSGYTFVSYTATSGSYSNSTHIWTVGNFNNGAKDTLWIVATVLATEDYSNYAQVWTSDQHDPDSNPGDGSTTDDDDDRVLGIIPNFTGEITGIVFNDLNGLTDGIVNGTGTDAGGLYANLVNTGTGFVLASVQIQVVGTYVFTTSDGVAENTTYEIILTSTSQSIGNPLSTAVLPTTWISTGENVGAGAGDDGTVDSKLIVSTTMEGLSEANFGIVRVPDVTPILTAVPNVMHGITNFNLTIKVTELNVENTHGPIIVRIPKDSRWDLDGPFNIALTDLGGIPIDNSVWSYSYELNNHVFTTNSVISAGSFSTFGFNAVWNAGQTRGILTITSQIESWSGGEERIDNNVDAEKLDYFID